MKKINLMKKIGFVLFTGAVFFGCKSAPVENRVNPLDLLDGESAIYFAIPTKADTELVSTILKNNVDGISDSDVNTLLERVDIVYAGILHSKNQMIVQSAISANIPSAYHAKIFSKKNGWTTSQYQTASSKSYNLYTNEGITISLPDSNTICLGRDINRMLDTYDILRSENTGVSGGNPNIDDIYYEHLLSASNEVKFFAQKPQSFLTLLTGANLDLKLIYVMGEIKVDPKNEKQYLLDLNFEFKNEKYVKPGKALLTLSFG